MICGWLVELADMEELATEGQLSVTLGFSTVQRIGAHNPCVIQGSAVYVNVESLTMLVDGYKI